MQAAAGRLLALALLALALGVALAHPLGAPGNHAAPRIAERGGLVGLALALANHGSVQLACPDPTARGWAAL